MTDTPSGSVGLAERLVEVTDWSSFRRIAGQPAIGVDQMLLALLGSPDAASAGAVRDSIETEVAVQGNLYSAAEPTIRVLAASFVDPRPRRVRIAALDLMFLILSGAPVRDEIERGNGALRERCVDRVRESIWAIAREALADAACYEAALDVLTIVDQGGSVLDVVRSQG